MIIFEEICCPSFVRMGYWSVVCIDKIAFTVRMIQSIQIGVANSKQRNR